MSEKNNLPKVNIDYSKVKAEYDDNIPEPIKSLKDGSILVWGRKKLVREK